MRFSPIVCFAATLLTFVACRPQSSPSAKGPPASKVEMVPHESDLATITLTQEAEGRLGISTVPAALQNVQQHRVFGGEVIVPSGRSIVIAAPVPGMVSSSGSNALPMPGSKVLSGQAVLKLTPILSPERDVPTPAEQVQMTSAKATLVAAQAMAMGDIQRARADVAATKIAFDRASKLFADRAGSQRAVDDAQALANISAAALAAAEERYAELTKGIQSLERTTQRDLASEITLTAPVNGVIRSISVSPGQQVVSGTSLFEVLDISTIWVRVPIFVDLLASMDRQAIGRVVALDGKATHAGSATNSVATSLAVPVEAPPTADASSSSADLYFEVSNPKSELRPGQRVGIELPMSAEVEAIVVPAASILYDMHGGTWVYVVKEPHRFVRKRVSVLWFDGPTAILQKGPETGTMVVADGAAELFGTEFGPGK